MTETVCRLRVFDGEYPETHPDQSEKNNEEGHEGSHGARFGSVNEKWMVSAVPRITVADTEDVYGTPAERLPSLAPTSQRTSILL